MNQAQAKRVVLVGTIGAGTLTAIAAFRRGGGPSFRVAVGVLVTGTILAAGAELQPDVAAGFAILMLTTSAFVVGGDAWQAIADATKPDLPPNALAIGQSVYGRVKATQKTIKEQAK